MNEDRVRYDQLPMGTIVRPTWQIPGAPPMQNWMITGRDDCHYIIRPMTPLQNQLWIRLIGYKIPFRNVYVVGET